MKHPSRVFVAGHTGLVGSAFVRRFTTRSDVQLLVVPRTELDLTDSQAVQRWLCQEQPDVVIVAAGRVGGIVANSTYPASFLYQNLMIEANLIHGSWKAGITRLLNFGSSCMYPKQCPQPMHPDLLMTGKMEPTSEPYAVAKWAGISLCAAYNRQYGTRFLSAIPCTLYGPGDNFDLMDAHVLSGLIRKFHEARRRHDETVTLWGSGQARREFLHVDDLVPACERLLQTEDAKGPVNIGSGTAKTIEEIARMIAGVVGFDGKTLWDASRPDGAPEKLLDSSAIRRLGWSPKIDLHTGLERTWLWFMEHQIVPAATEEPCVSS